MKLATMKLTLSSRSCPWRGSGFGLGIHFRVLLIASQLSISCFANFCEEHTRSSSYLWVASLDRFAANYKFWTTWVHFGLCPRASKLCLPSVYPWCHARDKMYQVLPFFMQPKTARARERGYTHIHTGIQMYHWFSSLFTIPSFPLSAYTVISIAGYTCCYQRYMWTAWGNPRYIVDTTQH